MFENRQEAGRLLVEKLLEYKDKDNVVVFGITRGGVIPARIIADALNLSFDIIVVKKIGAPGNPELAIGAVGPQEVVYWEEDLCQRIGVNRVQSSKLKVQSFKERNEKDKKLRGNRKQVDIREKKIILIDDGVATGATVMAAFLSLKKAGAREIILAVPVIAKETFNNIKKYFDRVIVLEIPDEFYAVGQFYREFTEVTDEDVNKILSTGSLDILT